MPIEIEYTDREITPWGGVAILIKMLEKMDFSEVLRTLGLPEQKSNRGYSPEKIITSYIVGIWCGANRISDLEIIRGDRVIKEILGYTKMCGQKTYSRYFSKFNEAQNIEIFGMLYQWIVKNIKSENHTLDVDSTVISRYGEQEGAKKGYNPSKRGRNSHHPLLAMLGEERKVVNFWLRSGDTYSSNNFINFLEQTLEIMKGKQVNLLRADSGFFSEAILNHIETKHPNMHYVISAKLYKTIKRIIISHSAFHKVAAGIEIGEFNSNLINWQKGRRFIVIRQNVKIRPNATGKELSQKLFPEILQDEQYRYSVIVTNLDLSPELVWKVYRDRANCENIIKELKTDFGLESFNMSSFPATEVALNFAMIAYNLMNLFKDYVLRLPQEPMMKNIRYRILNIGATIIKTGRKKILNLSLQGKRRGWFDALWNYEYFFPT